MRGLLERVGLLGGAAFLALIAQAVAPAFRVDLPIAAGLVTVAVVSNSGENSVNLSVE